MITYSEATVDQQEQFALFASECEVSGRLCTAFSARLAVDCGTLVVNYHTFYEDDDNCRTICQRIKCSECDDDIPIENFDSTDGLEDSLDELFQHFLENHYHA